MKVTFRRIRVTTIAVQKQDVLHILCVCLQLHLFRMHSAWPHYSVTCVQPSSTFTSLFMEYRFPDEGYPK